MLVGCIRQAHLELHCDSNRVPCQADLIRLRRNARLRLDVSKSVPQRLKPSNTQAICGTAEQAAEKFGTGQERLPQGLKPDIFSILYGPTEVVP